MKEREREKEGKSKLGQESKDSRRRVERDKLEGIKKLSLKIERREDVRRKGMKKQRRKEDIRCNLPTLFVLMYWMKY